MSIEDYIPQIDSYLNDELSQEEKDSFENFLYGEDGAELQIKVDAELATRNFLILAEKEAFGERFKKLDEILDKKKTIIIRRNWGIGIAAVISLIIVSTFLLINNRQDPFDKMLVDIRQNERVNLMSTKNTRSKLLDKVDDLLAQGNCGELERVAQNSLDSGYIQLVLGICYIQNKDYSSAHEVFESEGLRDKRAFFQGYIYASQGDTLKACQAFQQVIEADGNMDHLKEAGQMFSRYSCNTD